MPLWSGATLGDGSLWFWGGGHADYGGNEVYQYDLNEQRWRRYGPWLEHDTKDDGCKVPRGAPASAHSASGLWWAHGELWISGYSAFCRGGGTQQVLQPNVWSFNPRNEQWTPRGTIKMVEPHVAYDQERDLLYVWSRRYQLAIYKGKTLELIQHRPGPLDYVPDYSHLLLDAEARRLYGISKGRLYKWSLDSDGKFIGDEEVVSGLPDARSGYALRQGKLYVWPGGSVVTVFDPVNGSLDKIEAANGPSGQYERIFSKWQYDAANDRFLGLSTFDHVYAWWPPRDRDRGSVEERASDEDRNGIGSPAGPHDASGWHFDPISFGGLAYHDPTALKPTIPSESHPTAGLTSAMSTTGDRADIGLITGWQAALLSGDLRYRDAVIRQGSGEVAGKLRWSAEHAYPLYWVPYLLTGEEQYLDRMRDAWKKYQVEYRRRNWDGPIEALTEREFAWQLRNLARLAKADETYRPILEQTRRSVIKRYIQAGRPGRRVLHNVGPERRDRWANPERLGIATWQQAFVTQALAHVVLLGFEEWRPILEHNFRLWRQFVERKMKHIDSGDIYYWSKKHGNLGTWDEIIDEIEKNETLRDHPDDRLIRGGVRHIRAEQVLNATAMAAIAGVEGARDVYASLRAAIEQKMSTENLTRNVRDWLIVD